jgi:hypothetical protein
LIFSLPFGFVFFWEDSALACLSRQHLIRTPFFSSDLVNGLVALMNSNVSSPVNLVSAVVYTPLGTAQRVILWETRLCFVCLELVEGMCVCYLLNTEQK